MEEQNDFEQKIKSEQQCMSRVTNDDMVCKDCMFKYEDDVVFGNTSTCRKYKLKPGKVIMGDECTEYIKRDI